jgi:hypothetical protein
MRIEAPVMIRYMVDCYPTAAAALKKKAPDTRTAVRARAHTIGRELEVAWPAADAVDAVGPVFLDRAPHFRSD